MIRDVEPLARNIGFTNRKDATTTEGRDALGSRLDLVRGLAGLCDKLFGIRGFREGLVYTYKAEEKGGNVPMSAADIRAHVTYFGRDFGSLTVRWVWLCRVIEVP